MDKDDWIRQLFQSIDDRDVDTFPAFLSEDVLFRFGNAQPVNGKAVVGNVLRGFLRALGHFTTVLCHGIVTYTRTDSSTLSVPFANILRIDADLITEYLNFVDVSGLYRSA